jgi:hypothetical protein
MKLTHCVLLASLLIVPFARAQQTVSWADFTKIVQDLRADQSLEYTVLTKSGVKKKISGWYVYAEGVHLIGSTNTRPDQIVEIQVRHRGRMNYFGRVEEGVCAVACDQLMQALVFPVDAAFGAVATPPLLVVEGTRRLFSPVKTYKIVP